VTAAGRPVARAKVEVFRDQQRQGEATTATDGAYTIAPLPPGDYAVLVSYPPDRARFKTALRSPVRVKAGEEFTASLSLSPVGQAALVMRDYIYAAGRLVAVVDGGVSMLRLDEFEGMNDGLVALPPLEAGSATLSGGQIFFEAAQLPVGGAPVYGTLGGGPGQALPECRGCREAIEIQFAAPVSNVSLEVLNGAGEEDVVYTVRDDLGHVEERAVAGTAVFTFPDSGVRRITISGRAKDGRWAFYVDNISFVSSR